MRAFLLTAASLASLASFASAQDEPTFDQYRAYVAEHQPTRAAGKPTSGEPLPTPPASAFSIVRYESDVGYQVRPGERSTVASLGAYLTPDPGDGLRHPAIVWLTGGETNTLGEVWSPRPWENDQSAAAYREAGLVMMFPSLRGGNDNPGRLEGLVGEVDDVLAATAFLKTVPYVDPDRIYLGGHSTGGTLALLVAATAEDYAGVVAFGPVASPHAYPDGTLGVSLPTYPDSEFTTRAPVAWMKDITEPVVVIEGEDGNAEQVALLRENTPDAAPVRYVMVEGADHFDVLAPANALIAAQIAAGEAVTVDASDVAARRAQGH